MGNIRSFGYFMLDFLKGNRIKNNLVDIDDKMNGRTDNSRELSAILKYAKENVPFYSDIDGSELSNFPVITKQNIMNNFDEFQSKEYTNKKLHWVSTSGSTGTPFKANQNREKRNRNIADLIYAHEKNGWALGDKYVYLRAWTSKYSSSKLKAFLQNYIAMEVVNFNDKNKEKFRQLLKRDRNIKVILGYASAMEDFVHYLENKGDDKSMFNIEAIFTVSDNLSDSAKEKLEKMFGCPVINRYSNEELGLLAYTPPYSSNFQLNIASYHFELLKLDSDEPVVNPGEMGRLVVTDLYNKSMPFIRYDTGDLAVSNDSNRKSITKLSSLQGRITDVLKDTKGNLVTAPVVNNYFAEFYNIKKYQLIQYDKNKYLLKVVEGSTQPSTNEYIKACKKVLGEEAKVNVEKVEDISAEENGKFKTIINKYTRI